MASDYIAEALKKCKKKKPVIVSQGLVAASGGYWLSMYADTILAAPNTITGSIGVIGGWDYNMGLKEKLGVSTDFVKRGDHAEITFGATVPLLGISLPDRNLNSGERARMEYIIKAEYKDKYISKKWIKIKCQECEKESVVQWCKISSRKYFNGVKFLLENMLRIFQFVQSVLENILQI
jgi:hypothetical protein